MMSLSNSINIFCFLEIFDPSDPYENYPDQKTWLQPQLSLDVNVRIVKMKIGSGITV